MREPVQIGPIRGGRSSAPPSPDYFPALRSQSRHSTFTDYVPGPEHADDEIVAEDQPYAEDASPTAQSPDYVPESDPEADPEKDDDEDPEEDPADEDEEEEEHSAPADSAVVALRSYNQAPSAERTERSRLMSQQATPPPHPAYRVTAMISIPAPIPTPVWSDAEVARLLAISTLPSSPLSLWSSPHPQIPSSSLPLSPPSPVLSPAPPPSPIRSFGYRAAMIRMRAEAASTSHSLQTRCTIIRDTTTLAHINSYFITTIGYYPSAKSQNDTDEIYTRLDDEQSQRQLLAGQLNMLFRDRQAHAYTRYQMETEARLHVILEMQKAEPQEICRDDRVEEQLDHNPPTAAYTEH
ncbi:hypothetical protein Tco_1283398 [Tanacetum coccineum]